MIDTPVFGFFHRARPPPAQPTHALASLASAGNADEREASAPTSDSPDLRSPQYDQAPATVLPHPVPSPAPVDQPDGCFTRASVAAKAVGADQLGLAHPLVITLTARLESAEAHELDASASGIYRPTGFRAAPWSGFAYDEANDARIGLAAGTRILTAKGEIEVERLLPGDTALALRGPALLPIAWIGRTVAAEHSVCIDAGALGPNLPRRALCVAADQPIFLAAMPVAARTLLNGSTIRPTGRDGIDMFHIDVGRSEILFAEGLPLSSGERVQQQRSAPPALS